MTFCGRGVSDSRDNAPLFFWSPTTIKSQEEDRAGFISRQGPRREQEEGVPQSVLPGGGSVDAGLLQWRAHAVPVCWSSQARSPNIFGSFFHPQADKMRHFSLLLISAVFASVSLPLTSCEGQQLTEGKGRGATSLFHRGGEHAALAAFTGFQTLPCREHVKRPFRFDLRNLPFVLLVV